MGVLSRTSISVPAVSRVGWRLLWLLLVFFAARTSFGAEGLVVTADSLEMDQKQQTAVFSGNVVAEDSNMRLAADKMVVQYVMKSRTGGGRGSVREVKADGNVSINQGENRGTAQNAVYSAVHRTLELVGGEKNASIHRGKDYLEGKKILLTLGADLKIDRVSVQGGGGKKRVSARITSSGGVEGGGSGGGIPDLVGVENSGGRASPKEGGAGAASTRDDPGLPSPPAVRPVQRPGREQGD
ncbi:MAG: OstA family protein [Magnetococcales bacterium]|nr:OstA family protein [Magnetococcales bacterium]